ncbi:MAG: hypothetical protein ACPGVG_20365, partial [Mycobacterium sp.]
MPLEQGELTAAQRLIVRDPQPTLRPGNFPVEIHQVGELWPDGSLKNIAVSFIAELQPGTAVGSVYPWMRGDSTANGQEFDGATDFVIEHESSGVAVTARAFESGLPNGDTDLRTTTVQVWENGVPAEPMTLLQGQLRQLDGQRVAVPAAPAVVVPAENLDTDVAPTPHQTRSAAPANAQNWSLRRRCVTRTYPELHSVDGVALTARSRPSFAVRMQTNQWSGMPIVEAEIDIGVGMITDSASRYDQPSYEYPDTDPSNVYGDGVWVVITGPSVRNVVPQLENGLFRQVRRSANQIEIQVTSRTGWLLPARDQAFHSRHR